MKIKKGRNPWKKLQLVLVCVILQNFLLIYRKEEFNALSEGISLIDNENELSKPLSDNVDGAGRKE